MPRNKRDRSINKTSLYNAQGYHYSVNYASVRGYNRAARAFRFRNCDVTMMTRNRRTWQSNERAGLPVNYPMHR